MDHFLKKMKNAKYLTEPFMTTDSGTTKKQKLQQLEEALDRYRLQNLLLWQLLEKYNIEVPDAIANYAEIDMFGKEAKIYADLESIQRRLDSLMAILTHINFNCLPDRPDQAKTNLDVADDALEE